ncbi:MAG: PAS domain S-box protein, partial [Ardenticatenales bacterium]|nr:PAS domain S-box protein [Ardenticatenales bacterium]
LVLRTGDPGEAPERKVLVAYDIDGYVTQTELTVDKLFSLVISGLRAYKTIMTVEGYRQGAREWQNTFDATNDAIWTVGQDQRILRCNETAERLFQRPPSEMIGKHCWEIVHGTTQPIPECPLLRARDSLRRETTELQIGEGWYQVTVDPILDETGGYAGAVHIVSDITERVRVEKALRLSQARHEQASKAGQSGVWDWDLRTDEIFVDPNLKAMLGYADHEIRNQLDDWGRLVHPDDAEAVMAAATAHIEGRTPVHDIAHRMLHRDGSIRWYLTRGTALRDENGVAYRMIGTDTDITERKQAEEELYLLKNAVDESAFSITLATMAGVNTYGNKAAYRAWGYDFEHDVMEGTPVESGWAEPEKVAFGMEKLIQHGSWLGELVAKRKDGSCFDCQVSASVIKDQNGKPVHIMASHLDITERKQAEQALQRRAEELAALQATVLEITVPHDLPTLLQTIVERATLLLNALGGGLYLCDPDQEQARCVVSYNTPHDYTGTVLKYGEGAAGTVAKTGEPLIIEDYRAWSGRAGAFEEEQPFTAVLSAPMIWKGQVTGVVQVLHEMESRRFTQADLDLLTLFANHAAIAVENARLYEEALHEITERKQAESQRDATLAALCDSQHMLQTVLDSIPTGVFWKDRDSFYVGGNRAWLEWSGLESLEAVVGKSDYDLPWEKKQSDSFREDDRRVMESGIPEYDIIEPYLRADDTHAWARTNKVPLRDTEGNVVGVLGTTEDITERKQAEKTTKEQARLLDLVFEHSLDSIVLLDKDYNFIRVSEAYAEACQRDSSEFPGHNHFEFYPSSFKVEVDEAKKRKSIYRKSARPFVFPDHPERGTSYWDLGVVPILDEEEEIELFLFTLRDVTEQRQAQAQLEESEARFRALFERSSYALGMAKEGVQVMVNSAYLELFGYDQDTVLTGKSLVDDIAPEERAQMVESVRRRAKGEPVASLYETRGLRRDGSVFDVELGVSTYEFGGEMHTVGFLRDISEQKRTEQERQRLYEQVQRHAEELEQRVADRTR